MNGASVRFSTQTITNQAQSLQAIADLIRKGMENPRVRATALQLVADCQSRDDNCELQAIFDAVKHGDQRVTALKRGFKYVADPKTIDFFAAADRSLAMCEKGGCGGDCDDHTILVGALCGSIGFTPGARAYGPKAGGPLVHVYPVVLLPKKAIRGQAVGLDTTVPRSYVGWEPPPGRVVTAWVKV